MPAKPRPRPTASPPSDLRDDVDWWQDVLALHAAVEQRLAAALRRHRVGLSEYRTLSLLAGSAKSELRILDLADALNLSQSSMSRLVDRLESAELVYREACGDDRRGVFTVLTAQGKRLCAEIAPTYRQALQEALAHVATDNVVLAGRGLTS